MNWRWLISFTKMLLNVLRYIMDKRFSRTALLLGDQGLGRLQAARVAVFGLGGVGAYTAESLVRSGVGYMRIVDFDTVKLSNCNRQILAVESTVGMLKTDAAYARLKDINPLCEIDRRVEFIDERSAPRLLDGIEYVVDAIDSVSSKVSCLRMPICCAYQRLHRWDLPEKQIRFLSAVVTSQSRITVLLQKLSANVFTEEMSSKEYGVFILLNRLIKTVMQNRNWIRRKHFPVEEKGLLWGVSPI
jgi:hypothetical protein